MRLKNFYFKFTAIVNYLRSPLLLAIRLFWGGSFILTGWGKFGHLAKVTAYFQSLGIPFASLAAILTAFNETVFGLCLLLGFACRLTTIPLIATTIVAILTAEQAALSQILSNPQNLIHTDPFSFFFASLIIFVFGPGAISIDRWLWDKNV